MKNLAVKFPSAVSVAIVASAAIVIVPLSGLGAAECLTTPKAETPPGTHWYYRIERSTKRHCWFLREGDPSSKAATSTPVRPVGPEAAPDRETKLTPSAADALAEISTTTAAASVAPTAVEQEPFSNNSSETAQSLVASRWPEPVDVAPERPISPSLVVAAAASDANLAANAITDLTPEVRPVTSTKVETLMGMPVSLQVLHLGIVGVIAVLSLAGSAIYLLGCKRRRPQRMEWPTEEPTYYAGVPPWLQGTTVNSTSGLNPAPDAGSQSSGRQRSSLGANFREIEQLLARFTDQAAQAKS